MNICLRTSSLLQAQIKSDGRRIMTNKKRCIGIGIVVFAVAIVNSSWIVRPPDLKQHPSGWYGGGEYQGKEGVIFQTSYNDCGPAALQMIFDHYKIPSTIGEIRRQTMTLCTLIGSSARDGERRFQYFVRTRGKLSGGGDHPCFEN